MSDRETSPSGEEWTLEYVRRQLQNLSVEPEPQTVAPDEYEKAAAILVHYDPKDLTPLSGASTTTSKSQVLMNSSVIFDEHGKLRSMLLPERRRAALNELGQGGIRAALTHNPRVDSPLQDMFDAYVKGNAPALDKQSPAQLAATLQVTEWLADIVTDLPNPADIQRRVAREQLLRPFRELAGTAFAGRRSELIGLRDYVGFLESRSIWGRGADSLRSLFGWVDKPPLIIHAPGGMGKSALLARFILDHLEVGADGPALPFVYLDFDRANLVAERPMTLLFEAATQLVTQFPALADRWAEIKPHWLSILQRSASGSDITEGPLLNFWSMIEAGGLVATPLLFVLDTFEEVQYRSRDFVEEVFGFLGRMREQLPRLRVVAAGRAPVTLARIPTTNQQLRPLDMPDAVQFLTDRGITDPSLASRVAEQVGGNPLNLRLALEVLQRESAGRGGIEQLQTRNRIFMRLQDNQIQGQLYRRILNHIHDERVAKLAHPGLVLRRVTPELILEVLAQPCGVDVRDIAHARSLFEQMKREVSLVTVADDGSLRHRPEVRHAMLALLRRDEPVKVRLIQENAVAFYRRAGEDDAAARAEMLYHMLLLGRPRNELDAVWSPRLIPYLGDAAEDIADPAMRAWLTARIGVAPADDAALVAGDLEDWEVYALRRVRDILKLGKPDAALEILRQRDDRTYGSALYFPQAVAQLLNRDITGAQNSVATGLREATDPETILKLEVTASWVDRLSGEAFSGDAAAELRRLQARFGDDPRVLRFGLNRLEPLKDRAPAANLRKALVEAASATSNLRLLSFPQIGRDLAARLGEDDPALLVRLAQLFGLRVPSTSAFRDLSEALDAWDEQSGLLTRYHVELTPSSTDNFVRNLSLLARDGLPAGVRTALARCFDDPALARTDQALYDEIETAISSPTPNLA